MEKPTALGRAVSGKAANRKPSSFAQAISGARVFEPWVVPRLNVECAITLIPANRAEEVEGAVAKRMDELKIRLSPATETVFETARARLVAHYAVVSRDEPHEPIGTTEEWAALDPDIIGDFWRAYHDVREAYDPVAMDLTDEEVSWVVEGIKKKEHRLLRLCGVRRLATYLLSMGDLPSSLVAPSFGAISSSPAISPSAAPVAPDEP